MAESTERPIVVVGFQRSGTTLIQALLGAHPRIAAPPEVHFWLRIALLEDYWGDLSDDGNLRRVIHELLHPPVQLYDGLGFDEDRLFARMAAGERTLPRLLRVFMDDFAERRGKPRWSEKSPGQTAAQSLSLVPDAQLVHIIRDPRDVVASSLATPWTGADASTLARRWRAFNLDAVRVGARVGAGSYLRIRYEDLTRDPESVLRVVFAYLREDWVVEVLTDPSLRRPTVARTAAPWQRRVLEGIGPPQNRRGQLTAADRARIAAIVRHVVGPWGYDRPTRGDAVLGTVLEGLVLPTRLPAVLRASRQRAAGRDPAGRKALVDEFLTANARAVSASSEATGGS